MKSPLSDKGLNDWQDIIGIGPLMKDQFHEYIQTGNSAILDTLISTCELEHNEQECLKALHEGFIEENYESLEEFDRALERNNIQEDKALALETAYGKLLENQNGELN